MGEEKALPQTAEQMEWVHEHLAFITAWAEVILREPRDEDEIARVLVLCPFMFETLQCFSRQGIQALQDHQTRIFEMIMQEVIEYGRAREGGTASASDLRHDFANALRRTFESGSASSSSN